MRTWNALDSGWHFIRKDIPAAEQKSCDAASWQTVDLPHTWNAGDGYRADYYRGVGWYRRDLSIGPEYVGRRVYLRFEGSSLVTQVYLNGQFVGEHRGAFAAFCFDITGQLRQGENLLAIRVDNRFSPEITPLGGDWTFFGGLYRSVALLAVGPLHISALDEGSPGVYLTQRTVCEAFAEVGATAKVRNAGANDEEAMVEMEVRDDRGGVVARSSQTVRVEAGQTRDADGMLQIATPHLWDGVRDPYLYAVWVRIYRGGELVDELHQPLGLRYFSIDPAKGLILNGRPYPYRGVNYHQEVEGKGWAIGRSDQDRDFGMIRELGCTGVRMSHYQHAEYEYELCDRMGLVVWDELALAHQLGHSPAFAENARQQLRELIKQHYNHPSILFWCLFNEINIEGDDVRWGLVPELNDLAHALDGTRPTVAASNLGLDHRSIGMPDVIAFNRYWGWYADEPEDWGRRLDGIAARFPGKPVGISEYGAGANVLHQQCPPHRPKTDGPWHPEQWQCHFHEQAWKAQVQRPWLWCNLIWALFDFASAGRNEGGLPGCNDKGLVTADRKVKKDAFYFYKANWSKDPVVHLTDRRFDPRPAGITAIKVYSNCPRVELIVNGCSCGERSGEHGVFTWEGIEFTGGRMEVEAIGRQDGQVVSSSCTWSVAQDNSTARICNMPQCTQKRAD